MTTEELYKEDLRPLSGGVKRWNYSIPVAPAFEGVHQDLPIPPYTLGAWLGDGSSDSGAITTHPDDNQILEFIKADGFTPVKSKARYRYGLLGLGKPLRLAGLLKNKHIPEIYFNASKEQRMELLRGLMDTDGTISNGRQAELCTTNELMARQYQRLANGLGIKAALNTGRSTLYGKDCGPKYRIQWTSSVPYFNLKRKLDRIPKKVQSDANTRVVISVEKVASVPTKCICVEAKDNLFLCTEDCIITHNSQAVQNMVANLVIHRHKVCVASFEQPPEATFAQILISITGDEHIFLKPEFDDAYAWLSQRVFMYREMKKTCPKHLINTFRQAHINDGVDFFVTDNVMTLNVDRSDNTAQAAAADRFRLFGSDFPVHNILVAHPRKADNASVQKNNGYMQPPSLADINGAGEWGNMPNNALVVWRDMKKADTLAEMENNGDDEMKLRSFWKSTPCGKFITRKQRSTGDLPMKSYWFDKETKRFMDNPSIVQPMYEEAPWKAIQETFK